MDRMWALVERDLRRFRRSPTLIFVSMVFPLVQLLVLGYAFGGKLKDLKVGVVDQDRGVQAVKLREMFNAVHANARTFQTIDYHDERAAVDDLKRGLPRMGAHVTSVKGDGQVVRQNVLRQTAVVRRADDGIEVEVTLEDLVEKRAE